MPTALITGSSRGIGSATAVRFARDGYDVVVNYRSSEEAADATANRIESETAREAFVVQADVGDPDDVDRLVARAVDTFGGLDHVVNNAGIEEFTPTPDLEPADFNRVMNVNLTSAFAVSRAAAPHLSKSSEPSPSITNVSSVFAFTGAAEEAHYSASKSAMLGLTRSHALEFGPEIRVNALAPGIIETDMTDHTEAERAAFQERIALDRYGSPAEIADAAAYLRDATYVTGETLRVDGGFGMR